MIIENKISDLEKEQFNFMWIDRTVYLDGYYKFRRDKKSARKWNVVKVYHRLGGEKRSTNNITEEEIPFTMFIRSQALEMAKEQITVKLWTER